MDRYSIAMAVLCVVNVGLTMYNMYMSAGLKIKDKQLALGIGEINHLKRIAAEQTQAMMGGRV